MARPKKKISITFDDLVLKYKKTKDYRQLSKSTKNGVDGIIDNHLLPAFSGLKLEDISNFEINSFLQNLNYKQNMNVNYHCTLADTTMYNIWLLLQRMLKYAEYNSFMVLNPCRNAQRSLIPKPIASAPKTYSSTGLNAFLDGMFNQDDKWLAGKVKNALITWLVLRTGHKCKEIYEWKWQDVNWQNNTILGKKVDDLTMMLLKQHLRFQKSWFAGHPNVKNHKNYIFISTRVTSNSAKPPGTNSFYQWLKKYTIRQSMSPISVRSLQTMMEEFAIYADSKSLCFYNILKKLCPKITVKQI